MEIEAPAFPIHTALILSLSKDERSRLKPPL